MSVNPRWNDIDREKPKKSEKSLSQCHSVQATYHLSLGTPDAIEVTQEKGVLCNYDFVKEN
jgi:hypothetical protein